MDTSTTLLFGVLIGLVLLYVFKQILAKQGIAPLPPGPPPKPIIGNLADLPPPGQQDWMHWLKLKDSYGPISSVTILGQTIVILNDSRIAFDLLEKRSNIYSSRPRLTFASELVGWEHALVMQTEADSFRDYRKTMHRVLGTKNTIAQFNAMQHVEVRRFMLRVLQNPADLVKHIKTEAGAVILKIAYGYNIEPHGPDPLVSSINKCMDRFSVAATPGTWMVDTLPFLKYVPSWLPGAGFKRTAAAWKKNLLTTVEKPYRFVHQQMELGKYPNSCLSNALLDARGRTLTPKEEQVFKWSAASIYAGGADTTVSTLSCFFLAIALYPEVQKKAQEELDRVLGPNTLPTFDDRPRLPYMEAIVKESLRWHPVGPMGIPHMCIEDNVYEGYLIPEGSLVMPNIWAFTHDPSVYPNPTAFNPDRFLGATPQPDPGSLTFGFGRRICPGRHLADSTTFLTVAQSLAVFDISTAGEGSARAEFLPGVISHPAPYKLDIRPRSPAHEALIRSVEVECPWEKGNGKDIDDILC